MEQDDRPGISAPEGLDYARLPMMALADDRLSDGAKLCMAAICSFCWGERTICWPSNRAIAARLGKSPRSIPRLLEELEAAGYLIRFDEPERIGTHREIGLNFRFREAKPHDPDMRKSAGGPSQSCEGGRRAGATLPTRAGAGPLAPARTKAETRTQSEARESNGPGGDGARLRGPDPRAGDQTGEATKPKDPPPTAEERAFTRSILEAKNHPLAGWAWMVSMEHDREWLERSKIAEPRRVGQRRQPPGPSPKVPDGRPQPSQTPVNLAETPHTVKGASPNET